LTAIQVLPGVELVRESIRSSMNFGHDTNAPLVPGALWTLINPNHYGAPGGPPGYRGPEDITQFYFYQGLLLLPLVAVGLARGRRSGMALMVAVPALWYSLGPRAGFYLLVARLPGFQSIRAPVHVWFVIALALAMLASSALPGLTSPLPRRWLVGGLLAVCMVDLWYWNMAANHLSYARVGFNERYDANRSHFRTIAARTVTGPLYRLWAPFDSPGFGHLNSMLDSHIEVTYGYNPLELSRYDAYLTASKENPRLLDSLGVTSKFNAASGLFETNPNAFPRLTAPRAVRKVASRAEAAALLPFLDPAQESIVEEPAAAEAGTMIARLRSYAGDQYRIVYRADRPTLARVAVPFFPGWRAEVGGRRLPVFPVDLALCGVMLPAGEHELLFEYQSTWFKTGAAISLPAWILMAGSLVWGFAKRRKNQVRLDQTATIDLPTR
jgi:hypothetical protein